MKQDLFFGGILTLIIILGSSIVIFSPENLLGKDIISIEGLDILDEENLFLTSFLRTEYDDKKISDVVSLMEMETIPLVWSKTNRVARLALDEDYLIKARYPDKEIILATSIVEGDDPETSLETYKKHFDRLEVKTNITLPYVNGGLVVVEMLT